MKHEREHLVSLRPDAEVFLLNYENFQWKNNLVNMRAFARPRGARGETEDECLDDNIVSLRKAVHYVASDLPTVMNGSWLRHMVRFTVDR